MARVITRFAPSPTGPLHLGHAFAAFTAWDLAVQTGGTMLLRLEDIDTARCTQAYEAQNLEDLKWLGLTWPEPVMRQSERQNDYAKALAKLENLGVTYRCRCTRGDIRAALSAPQEGSPITGPDGPIYPGLCRDAGHTGIDATIRLNIRKSLDLVGPPQILETGPLLSGLYRPTPDSLIAEIGDVVLARRDIGTSYHLAVTVDDAAQGVTLVTRGADLFEATKIHTMLQRLLSLPTPSYHHHRLIRDDSGRRLAKRDNARALALLRSEGASAVDIRTLLGFQI